MTDAGWFQGTNLLQAESAVLGFQIELSQVERQDGMNVFGEMCLLPKRLIKQTRMMQVSGVLDAMSPRFRATVKGLVGRDYKKRGMWWVSAV